MSGKEAATRNMSRSELMSRERLKGTAIVSIAHRPGVAAYHERKLALVPDGDRVTLVAA